MRGEGCGVVVLKRLHEAEADGDPVWAVIRGAAVNHGGAGTGLTVPNTPALEQIMETAITEAGATPSDIEYLEAHGTGTAVGDPIEINAVANVFGPGRDTARPLLIGSVKTNINHLESAAGIAGPIKAAMVVKRGVIPAHLHFRDPNPSIDWDRLPLRVTATKMNWPDNSDHRSLRLAGVNSFGISGTNACILVAEHSSLNSLGHEPGWEHRPSGAAKTVKVQVVPQAGPAADTPTRERGVDLRRSRRAVSKLPSCVRMALVDLRRSRRAASWTRWRQHTRPGWT